MQVIITFLNTKIRNKITATQRISDNDSNFFDNSNNTPFMLDESFNLFFTSRKFNIIYDYRSVFLWKLRNVKKIT